MHCEEIDMSRLQRNSLWLFLPLVWAGLAMATGITPVFISTAIAAETYPAKPVRIVVAAGPGGGDDFAARQIASKLSELLRQQFIVENRPGAGGMIGQTFVARSPLFTNRGSRRDISSIVRLQTRTWERENGQSVQRRVARGG